MYAIQRLRESLKRALRVCYRAAVLRLCMASEHDGAMLFFPLMSRRYEHGSTVLTSNLFEEWANSFGDEVMAAALIDRLVHHCQIVNIRGNSFRMRQHRDLGRSLHSDQPREPDAPPRTRGRRKEVASRS